MPSPATRLGNLPSYFFAILSERIRIMQLDGVDIVRLDIGNPDMPPPEHVVDVLSQSAHRSDTHGYSGYRGISAFREAVARYYQRRFDVQIDPETQVLPLLGSKEGIVNLSLAYLDHGDCVLIPDVGYPSYAQGARLANAEICWLPTNQENGYRPEFSTIPSVMAQNAKLLWLNYPNNPTGAVVDTVYYEQAVAFCAENDILLASDAPYVEVTFDGYIAGSALQADPDSKYTVEFMSFSKSHNMAGWRLGAAVGAADALKTLLRVKSNMDSGHFIPVYDAGIAALDDTPQAWIDDRNTAYQQRRDRILTALPNIGLDAQKAQGSLYIWARPNKLSAIDYVERALAEAHVSVAPGSAYGPGGESYIRISLGVPDERLDIALTRLTEWYGVLNG